MKLTMGGKELKLNTLMPEAVYNDCRLGSVRGGDKAKVGSVLLDTVIIGVEIEFEGRTELKEKKMILTDRSNSDLMKFREEFLYLADENGEMDMMDLIGEKCRVNIIHNISSRGNIFANIGKIESLVENKGEEM